MLLSGCAHHGDTFSPAAVADRTRALVTIYRPARFANAVLSPSVLVDGDAVFNTENGAYVSLYLTAGAHRFVLEGEQHFTANDELVVQLEPGQVSYLRIDTAMKFETGKPYTRSFGIVRVDEPTALNEIAHCRHQQAQLPSKYLGTVEARDETADEADTGETATFTIDRSSNPFADKRSRE